MVNVYDINPNELKKTETMGAVAFSLSHHTRTIVGLKIMYRWTQYVLYNKYNVSKYPIVLRILYISIRRNIKSALLWEGEGAAAFQDTQSDLLLSVSKDKSMTGK